jgi:energy-coupling factor transporter ATP-binding protein EcfA2
MRLVRFSVGNYRAFLDNATIELKPLTLLFGYNSAGKSALVRFLPIIGASSTGDRTTPLALDTAAVRGASFRDLLSRHGASTKLPVSLTWQDQAAEVHVEVDVRDVPERQLQVVERLRVVGSGLPVEATWNAASSSVTSKTRQYDVTHGETSLGTLAIPFRGLAPELANAGPVRGALETASEALQGLRDQVH